MPLTELMHYFNDQLQAQAKNKSLPATGLYKAGSTYGARFGGLTFSSRFRAIRKVNNQDGNESSQTIGHDSELIVRSVTGREFDIDDAFESLDNTDQIIHLDRLTRTLHSLNYLQQYDNKELLSLTVQPRHIVSVVSEHGKVFENILSDCGLGPERVLLRTRFLDAATLPHFHRAFLSYQSRGYKIGINIHESNSLSLLEQLGFAPDYIFLHIPGATTVASDPERGSPPHWLDPLHAYRSAKRVLVANGALLQSNKLENYDGYLDLGNEDKVVDYQRSSI